MGTNLNVKEENVLLRDALSGNSLFTSGFKSFTFPTIERRRNFLTVPRSLSLFLRRYFYLKKGRKSLILRKKTVLHNYLVMEKYIIEVKAMFMMTLK